MLTNKQQKQKKYIRNLSNLIHKNERFEYSIKDLKKGSYFSLNGENFYIEEVGTYLDVKWKNFSKRNESYYTTELKCFSLSTGETMYIEWEEDDEIEVYKTTESVRMRDITYNSRIITNNDLEEIADEEYGCVMYKGKKFCYVEEDTAAALYSSEKVQEVPVRMYEFYSEVTKQSLTIEMWMGDADERAEKECFFSEEVRLSAISVLKV